MLKVGKVNFVLILCVYIGYVYVFVCCCGFEVILGVKEIFGKKLKFEVFVGVISWLEFKWLGRNYVVSLNFD